MEIVGSFVPICRHPLRLRRRCQPNIRNWPCNRALAAGVGAAGATVATLAAAAKLDFGALTGVCLALSSIVLVCSMLGRWGQPPRLGRRVRASWGLEDEDPLAAAVATFKVTDRDTDEVFERKQANPLAVRDQLAIFLIAELNMEVYRAKRSASWEYCRESCRVRIARLSGAERQPTWVGPRGAPCPHAGSARL
jgi:hypothetical protein